MEIDRIKGKTKGDGKGKNNSKGKGDKGNGKGNPKGSPKGKDGKGKSNPNPKGKGKGDQVGPNQCSYCKKNGHWTADPLATAGAPATGSCAPVEKSLSAAMGD